MTQIFIQLEGTDYKIAYLAYNSFTAGTAEQSEKYNNELRAFSQECKQRGINNLVLDFRYNSGGEMECVQLLADILVPADKLESPFAFLQYNDKQSAQNRDLIIGLPTLARRSQSESAHRLYHHKRNHCRCSGNAY